MNRPNIRANDVRNALETVGLLDEILRLPDGLNTKLQTHGAPLSSSQAMRLMLARAIVGHPRLLVIDGTLDSLPDDLAGEVLARLTAQQVPWTLVITSNRPMITEGCDRVVTLGPQLLEPSSTSGF